MFNFLVWCKYAMMVQTISDLLKWFKNVLTGVSIREFYTSSLYEEIRLYHDPEPDH
jgi:hypothetical protein